MKYAFIDGNNLACRCAFANEALTNAEGMPTGVHFGFFQSLIGLKQKFNGYQMLIAWDGKSRRRMSESEEALKNGIIPELYKANRKKDEIPKPLQDFYSQAPYLQRAIGQTGIPQIRINEYEADDVIASYCKKFSKDNNEVVVITSDKDYYQMLNDNVSLYDGMKQAFTTKDSWESEWGIKVDQYVHVAAFMGDTGDNIFGVPGWGEKTATKEIKKYGTWENVLAAYEKENESLRKKYPDLHEDTKEGKKRFDILSTKKSDPDKETSRLKYPDIYWGMPYTGVAWAFDEGKIKMPKTTLTALMFKERIKVAFSLKNVDCDIGNLPIITQGEVNKDKLLEYFEYFDIETLKDAIDLF